MTNSEIINNLLIEFQEQRDALKIMISDLEKVKEKIDKLFPDSLDSRYIRFFEEKVKTATGMFNTILDVRKEIIRSLKDEIDLRKKINDQEQGIDIETIGNVLNVRSLADRIEQFQKRKDINEKKIDDLNIREIKN